MKQMHRQDEMFVPSDPLRAQHTPPAFQLDAVRSVRMHKQLAIRVALVVFVLIVVVALTRRPVYEAESLTYVEPLATKVMSDGSPGFYDPSRYDSYLDQQIQTAQRPDILAAAAAKLPEGVWRHEGESIPATALRLGSAVQVKRVGTSYQLSITATGPDPVSAAAAANAVTDAYLEQGSKDEHAISDGRIQLLTEERQRIQNELLQAHTEQNTLSTSLGVANPAGEAGNPYDAQLEGLRTELAGAREAHDVAAAQLQSMSMHGDLHSAGLAAAANDAIAGDTGLSTMKSSINQRRATLQSQMAGLTPSNPVYKLDQQEIAAMDRNLDTMTVQLRGKAEQNLQARLRQELERTAGVEAKLNAQLAQDTARATGAAPKLQRAAELAADITRLQAGYAGVDDSLRALQLETQGPGMAHLSVAATPPSAPAASRRNLLLLLAIPLAIVASIVAAVIARKRDPKAYTADDLQHILGFPPMAVMPAGSEVSEAVMEEYWLRLAAGVERAYRADGARSFVLTAVSSSMHISGLIEELARKLSELGFAVNAVHVDAVMRSDDEQQTGQRRDAGGASLRLAQLQGDYDLLLMEARPLLFSAEAEYAACAADATILVAESGLTLCKELKDAASLLERLHVKGVATVLNDLHLAVADSRFVASVEELERSAYTQRRREAKTRKTDVVSIPEAHSEIVPLHEPSPLAETLPLPEILPLPELHLEEPGDEPIEPIKPIHVEQAWAVPPAVVEVAETPVEAAVEAPSIEDVREPKTEPKIETIVAAPQPFRAPAPRQSSMWDEEKYEQPKPSFFDRIFKRFHEPAVSILPDREEDENAPRSEAPAEPLAAAASFSLQPTAEVVAVLSPEEDQDLKPQHETPTPFVAVQEPVPEVKAPVEVVHKLESHVPEIHEPEIHEPESYREEIAAVATHSPAMRQAPEETAVVQEHALLNEVRYPAEEQHVAREVAAARHAQAVEDISLEAEPAAQAKPVMQPESELPVAQQLPTIAEHTIVETATTAEAATTSAVQPMMRQWEFRQARSMRESAARESEYNAARVAEELGAYRRTSRPGVMSATGRRTLVEEPVVAVSDRLSRSSAWIDETAGGTPVPSRKWGMLSRFDQRFKLEDAATEDREHADEEVVAAYAVGHAAGRD